MKNICTNKDSVKELLLLIYKVCKHPEVVETRKRTRKETHCSLFLRIINIYSLLIILGTFFTFSLIKFYINKVFFTKCVEQHKIVPHHINTKYVTPNATLGDSEML